MGQKRSFGPFFGGVVQHTTPYLLNVGTLSACRKWIGLFYQQKTPYNMLAVTVKVTVMRLYRELRRAWLGVIGWKIPLLWKCNSLVRCLTMSSYDTIRAAPKKLRTAINLMPTTRLPCSNAAEKRNALKFAWVPQTRQRISAASRPKFAILYDHIWEILLFNKLFSDCR